MNDKLIAVSLFSSSGIGDLGLQANGIDTVIANELLPQRMQLFLHNHHETKGFCGDIWKMKDEIVSYYKDTFETSPFLLIATPPCQGMSSNGMGTILNNLKKGIRPQFDPRNRLIIPAIEIIKKLQPEWVILENVPNMTNTVIEDGEGVINIIDFVFRELGDAYVGKPYVVNVADYGVPQNRQRLITILTRTEKGKKHFKKNATFLPAPTHSEKPTLFTHQWLTVRDAIGNLPPISSRKGCNVCQSNPLHKVPLLDDVKLSWVTNTPEGLTAMNNQCINPSCKIGRAHV